MVVVVLTRETLLNITEWKKMFHVAEPKSGMQAFCSCCFYLKLFYLSESSVVVLCDVYL